MESFSNVFELAQNVNTIEDKSDSYEFCTCELKIRFKNGKIQMESMSFLRQI